MPDDKHTNPSEEEIRIRSYLIWEREGRPEGKSEEHWLRAKAELDAEFEAKWRAASLEGESTTFVLPLLPISTPPSRSVAEKIGTETPRAAAG
ncbi:MAG: DUF2934 domain-containing protein [Alphaproteobacteria bacterium]|nr:DUF2934 domain-containing protein [Alphaproteobacteria bacterium]